MNNPLGTTAHIAAYVEEMIAIPKALAFPDKPALYVLYDLILKGRNHYYLSHPEYLKGFQLGYECAVEEVQEFGLHQFTFGSVVHELELMLSHAHHNRDSHIAEYFGKRPVHHAYNVGSAFGWLSALRDHGFVLCLPCTPAELQRRSVSSPITSSRVPAFQKEIA